MAGLEIGLDRPDQRGAFHGGQEMAEEALLGALESRQRGGLGVLVEGGIALHDAGGFQGVFYIAVDHLEGPGIGVVDAPLLGRERMFEQLDLDPVIAERTGLVEPEGLQIAGHHLHRRDPAGLHGGDEIGALLEGRLAARISAAPQAEAPRIGQAGHGGSPGGGDIEDTGIGQGVLQTQSGTALLRGGRIAARSLGPGGVGHGVGLVEHDDAAKGMAGVFIHPVREPAHDLFEARALSLAGGRAQGCIGGEQDPGLLRNFGPLAELAQWDDVGFAAADRGPVAARVLEQLVGGGQPQRPAAAAQPVVEDDGGDLAALAAAGAVAQHPAAPETHRRGQGFAVAGGIGGGFKTGACCVASRPYLLYWRSPGRYCRHRRCHLHCRRHARRSPSSRRCDRARKDGGRGPDRRG